MAANLFVNEPESSVGITPAYYDAHMCSLHRSVHFDQHRYAPGTQPPLLGLTGEVLVPSESFRFIRGEGQRLASFSPSRSDITIDFAHPYHRCSTNYPYERSCPLSPALSPTSNDSVRFFPGDMRYAESHISSSSLVRDMCFGSVSSSASLPIQAVPSPGLSYKTTTYLIAGYAVLPFRWVS